MLVICYGGGGWPSGGRTTGLWGIVVAQVDIDVGSLRFTVLGSRVLSNQKGSVCVCACLPQTQLSYTTYSTICFRASIDDPCLIHKLALDRFLLRIPKQ